MNDGALRAVKKLYIRLCAARDTFIPAEKVKKRNSVENGGLCKFNCDSWFIFYANTGKSLWSIISFMIVQNS
jgi:hypothetical protein